MRHVPRLLLSSVVALGGVSLSAVAHASDTTFTFSPALTVSFTFGQHLAVGVGLDTRFSAAIARSECSDDDRRAVGGFFQITALNFRALRLAAGGHYGAQLDSATSALDAELGWTYRTRMGGETVGQHGIHIGGLADFGPKHDQKVALDVPLRLAIPLTGGRRMPEISAGMGVRVTPFFGSRADCSVVGRALRGDAGVELPDVFTLGERRRRELGLDAATRDAVAAGWRESARAECASIPAFLALARDLEGAGAPLSLVLRALRAAAEEERHTLLCARIASDVDGIAAAPILLDAPAARREDRREALLRLALESWTDGCLGEGAAAARAQRAERAASDGAAREALEAITRDEAGHAELAWSVLEHCVHAGGDEVRDALAERIADDAPPPTGDPERDADPRALRAHGLLAQAEADVAWREVADGARQRAAALLAA